MFVVNYVLQVRRLEAEGVPSKQAESITSCITQVLNDTLENVAHSFLSKAEMEKVGFSLFFIFALYLLVFYFIKTLLWVLV